MSSTDLNNNGKNIKEDVIYVKSIVTNNTINNDSNKKKTKNK